VGEKSGGITDIHLHALRLLPLLLLLPLLVLLVLVLLLATGVKRGLAVLPVTRHRRLQSMRAHVHQRRQRRRAHAQLGVHAPIDAPAKGHQRWGGRGRGAAWAGQPWWLQQWWVLPKLLVLVVVVMLVGVVLMVVPLLQSVKRTAQCHRHCDVPIVT